MKLRHGWGKCRAITVEVFVSGYAKPLGLALSHIATEPALAAGVCLFSTWKESIPQSLKAQFVVSAEKPSLKAWRTQKQKLQMRLQCPVSGDKTEIRGILVLLCLAAEHLLAEVDRADAEEIGCLA